ncbi:MAG: hypothetical protein M1321_02555 [Candidatus Marsarchaeota archaeon]|nr:hypothetical protein [Candidatus Marsarchaeota archaeon]
MDRILLVLGIALVVLGMLYGSSQLPQAGPQALSQYNSTVIVASNSYAYGSLYLNSSSLLEFFYSATAPVDFYLLNSTGFRGFGAANAIDAFSSISPENGLLYETQDSMLGAMPYSANYSKNVSVPVYGANNIVYSPGNYFFLFRNTNANSMDNVSYGYLYLPVNDIMGNSVQYNGTFEAGSIVAGAMFFAGVVLIFLSFFRKRGGKKQQSDIDAEAQRIYSRAGRAGARGSVRERRMGARKKRTKHTGKR